MRIEAPEIVAAIYFLYVAVAAVVYRGPMAPRMRVGLAASALTILLLCLPTLLPTTFFGQLVRAVLPLVYLVVGYWLPGWLDPTPRRSLERRLQDWDDALFLRAPGLGWLRRPPRWLAAALDVCYLFVYLFVPICLLLLLLFGEWSDVWRFWTAVLLAGYTCYGTLPWLPARPPRLVSDSVSDEAPATHRFAEALLGRVSVGLTTLPSGHVAVALAGALSVAAVSPLVGLLLIAAALGIAAGTVSGRYHYAVDALLGVAMGIAAWAAVRPGP